jgi:2-polyprenyl-3-methyl-5-hydroxy-6-metoxy-1,4-benzoquinol methylase
MDIEKYASEHPHYWADYFYNPNLEIILTNNHFSKFIDIGCGDGALLYTMAKRGLLNKFDEVWATDLSINRFIEVKKISSKIKTIQDDAQSLQNIPENYFDLVISTQVIEHVKDDQKMLGSLKRICKAGGIIFLETIIKTPSAWYFNRNSHGEWVLDPTHEREYGLDEDLFEKVKTVGLTIVGSIKRPLKFPLLDFFTRRINLKNPKLYESNRLFRIMRKIKIPIFGYFEWSIILEKRG